MSGYCAAIRAPAGGLSVSYTGLTKLTPKQLINKNEFVVGDELQLNDDWDKYTFFYGDILWDNFPLSFRNGNELRLRIVKFLNNTTIRVYSYIVLFQNEDHKKVVVSEATLAEIYASGGVMIKPIGVGETTGNFRLIGIL